MWPSPSPGKTASIVKPFYNGLVIPEKPLTIPMIMNPATTA